MQRINIRSYGLPANGHGKPVKARKKGVTVTKLTSMPGDRTLLVQDRKDAKRRIAKKANVPWP